jgi:hypothetical protein
MFSVAGRLPGNERRVILTYYESGTVEGDPVALARLYDLVEDSAGVAVGPVEGPYTYKDHLSDPLSAAILIGRVFESGSWITSGNVPTRPPIPEGAIG